MPLIPLLTRVGRRLSGPPRILLPLVVTAAVLACAMTGGATQTPGPTTVRTGTFERAVSPFAVSGPEGDAWTLPFLGGLDVPRPQLVDIDADGDLDLFLQEFRNEIWFFENTGSAKAPKYEWRTDKFQGIDVGEWYRFVDLDADGDFDVLAEQPFSNIRFYRNIGTQQAAKFESAATLTDTDRQPVYLDRQNIPSIVDLDCDGQLDLFIGRVEGLVTRYEAEAPGSLRFAFLTDHFENIEIIGGGGIGLGPGAGDGPDALAPGPSLGGAWPSPGAGPALEAGSSLPGGPTPGSGRSGPLGLHTSGPSLRHGANALAFADFDGDKDLDLFWGDFFEAGVLLIQNIGATCSSPSFQIEPVPLPYAGIRTSGYNAPMPMDTDGDGDLDFLMGVLGGSFNPLTTASDNLYFYERTAKDRLELRTKRFLGTLDFGSESVPAAGDLDADGDLDLIVGNKIDAAGDSGSLTILRNTGSATAPAFRQEARLKLVDAFHLAPALGDLDGDGDLDLLVGTWNQNIRYFRNTGTPQAPTFTEEPSLAIAPPKVTLASPTLFDIDGDRDLDLFVGTATGTIVFYRNDGTAKSARFTLVSERMDDIRVERRSHVTFADLNADKLPDLIAGRESDGIVAFRNAGTARAPRFVEDKTLLNGGSLPLPPLSTPHAVDLNGDGRIEILAGTVSGGLVFWR